MTKKILFVCSGNICRSPMAEAVFNDMVKKKGLDGKYEGHSAGMHDLHAGEPPDPQAQKAAKSRGYDLSKIRAQKIDPLTLKDYRLIVCMDKGHFEGIMELCHPDDEHKLKLLLFYANDLAEEEVPDPYGQFDDVFIYSLDLIEEGVAGLIDSLDAQME